MVWMITAYLQRAADIQTIADPLRRQLTLITGESGAADARIRRFNQAIREQIELLRGAQTVSQDDLEAVMDRVSQHRADLERFESVSTQQLKEIQDVVRRSMFQMEQMMDDKFTMLRVLDGKLQTNGDGVARQVESVGEQVTKMLEEIEQSGAQIADALERAQRDSQKLADTSRLQESSLTHAAEAASETLGGLSSKIDLSVTRFLERASTAREEAERLAHALDAQTRALDEFSSTLPVRVSEAESVLRGVADRLYASEQLAREQALNLSEKLSQQVDGLQSFLDRFTGRLTEVDAGLDRRQGDLGTLIEKVGMTTSGFLTSWEKSLTDLNDRTGNSLLRFTVVNDETRRNAESVAAHLTETTGKYEDVVIRMRALSSDSSAQMKLMTEDVAGHLSQFEALSVASNKAGEEVEARAKTALQNLQHVLERVLAARDSTQAVGETLVRDINDAVTQNEKMIQRLNETAQLGARAIGAATENLGRQQGELSGKARASETALLESVQKLQQQSESAGKSLREQTANLMSLLAETQGQLASTDQKLQSFATQAVAPVQKAVSLLDASAEQGMRTLGTFGEGLSAQVNRLQDFQSRIGGMSQDMSKATAESASAFEALGERFSTVRTAQEESARQTLAQFTDLTDRLQREVSGLDGRASTAVELLQQAAAKVGEQSHQMMEKAQVSGVQIKDIAASLQAEAAQIQSILRQQTTDISSDLARAEQKFTSLSETIREKADAAYALIDRTAAHYSEVSDKLDQTVGNAHGKVENLNAALDQQADRIGSDAAKIEMHASTIAVSSERAVENLAALHDHMAATHDASVTHSQQTLGKLDETAAVFETRAAALRDVAQNASETVIKAGAAFGEQTGRLLDGGHQIDDLLRQLTQATGALTDQALGIRVNMEQQNSRLLSQLAESVDQLDATGGKLRQVVDKVSEGADQASQRFVGVTDAAGRAETSLAALGVNITQQAASLAVVGDQIGEQQRILAEANEKQRVQALELFEKLSAAHTQASAIAERSIAYLSGALADISRQIGEVGDKSQTTIGEVKIASVGFSEQSALLIQNAQSAEAQARSVLLATAALQEQARQLRASLQLEGERASESLGVLLGRLTTGGAEVRELGTSTGVVFSTLQHALSEQANELNGSMQKISERQTTLTAALDAQREVVNGLLNRLTSAQDETAAAAERAAMRLNEGTQIITRDIETIDARAQDALNNVHKATAGFAFEAEAIGKTAGQIEQDARAIVASASGVHEQVSTLHSSIRQEGDLSNAVLGTLLDKVTTGATTLRDLSASTEMSLASLGNNVTQQCTTLATAIQKIAERQGTLATALDAQRDVVHGLLSRLTAAQDETATSSQRAAMRLSEDAQKIEQQIGAIDARTQSALVNMAAATETFTKEAEAIDTEAKHAEQQAQAILASASGLHGQIYDLRTSMQYDGERTTEVLNGLISRVTSGSGELREAGTAAEQTLTLMQNALGTKTGDLNASMQQIFDKQRTLTSTLEAQRETIDGLLARFAQAQNETAATAERAAARLNEGAQSITSSIDMIGAQASTSLASVQASVSGFAEQAKALNLQGQQAEQQMRGVMSVTAGMQEQAQHLREAMQSETAHVVEMLSTVIGQLDTAGRQLKTQSADATQALDQTTQRFSAASEMGTELLRTQSEAMAQMIDKSDARMASSSDKVRSNLSLVAEVGDKAEAQARQLADTAEFATTRLVTLRDTLDVSEKSGRDVVALASSRIEEVKAALQGQMQQLSEFSQKAVEQVAGATKTLAAQSDALRANLAASESALTEAADLVRVEAKQLPATLSRSTSNIEAATKTLKGQAAETDQALIGTADRFISATAGARNNMIEEMKRVSIIADDAGKILTGFNQLLAEQVASMQQSTAMLSSEQQDLVEKASLGVGSLSDVSHRLSSLRNEAAATAERLVREFDLLDQRAATTSGRLTQAGEGIAKQVEAITSATARAETQISGVSETLRVQLEQIRGGLQSQIDDISRGLLQITAQLERTGASLRSTAVGAVADVERVGQRFEETGAAASAQVSAGTDKMRQATDDVAKLLSNFSGQFDQMIDHMAQAGSDIKHQEGSAIDHLQRMLAHLGTVAEKLETARAMSGDISQHAIERLDEVVTAVQAQMNNLTAGAQTAAGVMRGIGQIYNDQTANLTKGVGGAHNQVMSMNKSIDEMQQRTDRMRAALKLQGDELMNSLRQILNQLEMTGDGLTDAVNRTLQQQASAGVKKIS
jgi:hypothetical protein